VSDIAQTGPIKTRYHLARIISLKGLSGEVKSVEGFNAKLAVILTRCVGSMACAYLFCLISLVSLPAILIQAGVLHRTGVPNFLTKPGLILIVAWVAQTFLQLVLLSVIMVGQSVQSAASDARAEKEFSDTEFIMDQVNEHTDGGLKLILERLDAIEGKLQPAKP
jgi:preprotein translocase subunit SecG